MSDLFDAMCLWEELLQPVWGASYPEYEAYRELHGACETRDRVIELVPAAQGIFKLIREEFDSSFDWEFCPRFLAIVGLTPPPPEDWAAIGKVIINDRP